MLTVRRKVTHPNPQNVVWWTALIAKSAATYEYGVWDADHGEELFLCSCVDGECTDIAGPHLPAHGKAQVHREVLVVEGVGSATWKSNVTKNKTIV